MQKLDVLLKTIEHYRDLMVGRLLASARVQARPVGTGRRIVNCLVNGP